MSSRLQLDVRNLNLGRRHVVNAYEVKAGIGVIEGKTVIHASAHCVYYKNERYHTTYYKSSVATVSLFCTVFDISP